MSIGFWSLLSYKVSKFKGLSYGKIPFAMPLMLAACVSSYAKTPNISYSPVYERNCKEVAIRLYGDARKALLIDQWNPNVCLLHGRAFERQKLTLKIAPTLYLWQGDRLLGHSNQQNVAIVASNFSKQAIPYQVTSERSLDEVSLRVFGDLEHVGRLKSWNPRISDSSKLHKGQLLLLHESPQVFLWQGDRLIEAYRNGGMTKDLLAKVSNQPKLAKSELTGTSLHAPEVSMIKPDLNVNSAALSKIESPMPEQAALTPKNETSGSVVTANINGPADLNSKANVESPSNVQSTGETLTQKFFVFSKAKLTSLDSPLIAGITVTNPVIVAKELTALDSNLRPDDALVNNTGSMPLTIGSNPNRSLASVPNVVETDLHAEQRSEELRKEAELKRKRYEEQVMAEQARLEAESRLKAQQQILEDLKAEMLKSGELDDPNSDIEAKSEKQFIKCKAFFDVKDYSKAAKACRESRVTNDMKLSSWLIEIESLKRLAEKEPRFFGQAKSVSRELFSAMDDEGDLESLPLFDFLRSKVK